MANLNDNLAVQETGDAMLLRHDEGIEAGYEGSKEKDAEKHAADMARGEAAWARFVAGFSPFERGFIFGRQVRLSETGRY
jgi:hypothetical protein